MNKNVYIDKKEYIYGQVRTNVSMKLISKILIRESNVNKRKMRISNHIQKKLSCSFEIQNKCFLIL